MLEMHSELFEIICCQTPPGDVFQMQRRPIVKTTSFAALLVCALLVSGCARNYLVTLNNGSRITATTKPRLEKGYYVFKDASGRPAAISAGRVAEIAPASMSSGSSSSFHMRED
jgi:hypothetical protein